MAAQMAAALIQAVPGAEATVQGADDQGCTVRLTYAVGRFATALDIRVGARALGSALEVEQVIRRAQAAAADVNARASIALAHAAVDTLTRREAWIRASRAQEIAAAVTAACATASVRPTLH